jgi:hypothetical protein
MSHWTNPALLAGRRVKPAFVNLAKLFAGGADGLMIDFKDQTTLFQDPNGILPVTANANPIGLALDQHKWGGKTLAQYRASQPEKITNGDFAANVTGWSIANAGNGALSWQSPGKLRTTATNSSTPGATQEFTCVVGRWYELFLNIVTASAVHTSFAIGTSAGAGQVHSTGNLGNAPGLYRRFFKATATTHYITMYGPSGNGNIAEFDNVSVKEIEGHHATQTSTARPTWASATGDVSFNGTSQYLITDFFFRDKGNHMAAWATFGASGANRTVMGAGHSSSSELANLYADTTGVLNARAGGSSLLVNSGVNVATTTKTFLVDQQTANVQLIIDGGSPASGSTPGDMPDAVRGIPLWIGVYNNSGAAASYFNGRLKRVTAGQLRVQDSMNAATFHKNLIA